MEHELVTRERAAKIVLDCKPVDGTFVHRGRVEAERVAAECLGGIHRRVGVAQEFFPAVAVFGCKRDPDTYRAEELPIANRKRSRERIDDPLGERDEIFRIGESRREDYEFVAADATDDVALANGLVEPLRDPLQQHVAGIVAEGIVDGFEAVDVDEEERGRRVFVGTEHPFETLAERSAIRKFGEDVVVSQAA